VLGASCNITFCLFQKTLRLFLRWSSVEAAGKVFQVWQIAYYNIGRRRFFKPLMML